MALGLFPYQEDGAAYLSTKARAGLLDDMGVGKSCQAVRACDRVAARRIVVICPFWSGTPYQMLVLPREHNPHLHRSSAEDLAATGRAIRLIREAQLTRRVPVILDTGTGERAVAVAVRILEGRCRLTGEDPGAVLDELERDT